MALDGKFLWMIKRLETALKDYGRTQILGKILGQI